MAGLLVTGCLVTLAQVVPAAQPGHAGPSGFPGPSGISGPSGFPGDTSPSRSSRPSAGWTGTWSASPTTVPASDTTAFEDQTLRQVVHAGAGGDAVRVRLSNEFGDRPLVVGEARVALRGAGDEPGARIAPRTDRPLTFGGAQSVTLPAGAPALSDPVRLRVPAGADLVISLHLPEHTPGSTVHASAYQENYVADGNVTRERDLAAATTVERWYFLSGVSVRTASPHRASAVVAFGDSLTDGGNTTPGANNRWPDILAQRLAAARGVPGEVGVLNHGISGNRLLHDANPVPGSDAEAFGAYFGESGLRRFDRDVSTQPGVRRVIVLLGVNDIGQPGTFAPVSERVTAEELIAGHRQLIARAHQLGLEIYGGTIPPFGGDDFGYGTPENEAARRRVNTWIRTGGEYDGVVDFDAALRDPAQPRRIAPRYDSGDGLHPNDAGARAMGHAVPLRLFR